MKHKTAELEGPLLDAAVAKAEGVILVWDNFERLDYSAIDELDGRYYRPSQDERVAHLILARERITMIPGNFMIGTPALARHPCGAIAEGPTPLIAAMRAFCASRFGEEVEL